jgi:hypothetical protein
MKNTILKLIEEGKKQDGLLQKKPGGISGSFVLFQNTYSPRAQNDVAP